MLMPFINCGYMIFRYYQLHILGIVDFKIIKVRHQSLLFNNSTVKICIRNNWGYILMKNLATFKCHINIKVKKTNKGIGIIRKLSKILPRSTLSTIHYSFVRPHLEYDDTICSQRGNNSFSNMIETVQYKASPVITGLVRGTFKKLYHELSLELFNSRRWLNRICYFCKMNTTQRSASLSNLIFQKINSF